MQIISKTPEFNFMGKRKIAFILSALLIAVSLGSLFTRGLNFGIDFSGGVLIEVGYPGSADIDGVRKMLADAGYADAQVQNFGTASDVLIRMLPRQGADGESLREEVLNALRHHSPDVDLRRFEFVGPQVGEELTEQGGLAMLFALIMILIYVTIRFQWKFALGSVSALLHDVILTLGFFSFLQLPFDLSVLAAVLAVIGYSLNDTIVVFDRIRENFMRIRKTEPVSIMNISLNQMLGRTLITSMTTLLVLVALFQFGGEIIHSFAIALIVGVIVGTYSSIYVASSIALSLQISTLDLMPQEKEVDEMP